MKRSLRAGLQKGAVSFGLSLALALVSCLAPLTPAAEARTWKTKFENKFSVLPSYYFQDIGQDTSQWSTVLREEPDFTFKSGREVKARLAPFVYADPVAASPNEKFIFDVNEASLDFNFGDVSLKAGVNPIAWGVTDFFNPLDVLSARRYTDLMNSERRGTPSVELGWDNGVWKAEGLYVPIQLESLLPGVNSRWLPRDIAYDRSEPEGRVILAPKFKYLAVDKSERDDSLHNNYGFRIERRGSGLDLTAIFFEGAPTAPAILFPVISGTPISYGPNVLLANEITLQPVYYIRRTAGVGAVLTLESMIIRFAAANSDRISSGTDLPGWSQSAVLGLEKNFAVGEGTLTALLQTTYARHEEQADNSIASLDRIFDRSWLLGFRYSASSDWAMNLATLYDTAYKGLYIVSRGEYKLADGWTTSLQVDVLEGDSGTPIGSYSKNDRATLGLTYFF